MPRSQSVLRGPRTRRIPLATAKFGAIWRRKAYSPKLTLRTGFWAKRIVRKWETITNPTESTEKNISRAFGGRAHVFFYTCYSIYIILQNFSAGRHGAEPWSGAVWTPLGRERMYARGTLGNT